MPLTDHYQWLQQDCIDGGGVGSWKQSAWGPGAVVDLKGAQQAHPRKFWLTMLLIPFCIRLFKNKAQIARESIKNAESFQGP